MIWKNSPKRAPECVCVVITFIVSHDNSTINLWKYYVNFLEIGNYMNWEIIDVVACVCWIITQILFHSIFRHTQCNLITTNLKTGKHAMYIMHSCKNSYFLVAYKNNLYSYLQNFYLNRTENRDNNINLALKWRCFDSLNLSFFWLEWIAKMHDTFQEAQHFRTK